MPKELITRSELEDLKLQRKPSFASLSKEENVVKIFDDETGIAQRRLSNGISINYKVILINWKPLAIVIRIEQCLVPILL